MLHIEQNCYIIKEEKRGVFIYAIRPMPPRNNENKKDVIKELENKISPVLVVNNSSLKPYVELFEYYPENIYQQPLGSLIGFFEVKEYSENSAYIVNFLTSVLKKEYYINPKRPVAESLDSALHKVNIALSELAKQGNVEWLGNLNAAICVLEKNNAHFSVSGNAKMFIFRNGALSNISDGLASDSLEPHPLKTFLNVSSGRLEKDDRMLITSEDIFHIFSEAEIKKNFQRFEGEKFVQFLKTALSNQLELIASIIVEMKETKNTSEVKMPIQKKKSAAALNAFSEKTFTDAKTKKQPAVPEKELEIETTDEANNSEYTDEKTGHIYVQGEAGESGKIEKANIYWDMTKEKILQVWYSAKNSLRRKMALYRKELEKKKELRRIEKEKQAKIAAEKKIIEQERKAAQEALRLEEQEHKAAEEATRLEAQKAKEAEEAKLREWEEALEKERQIKLEEEKVLQEKAEEETEKLVIPETAEPTDEEIFDDQTEEFPTQSGGLSFKEKLDLAMRHYKKEPDQNVADESLAEPEITNEAETEKISWKEKIMPVLAKIKEKISVFSSQFLEKTKSIAQKIKKSKSEEEPEYERWTEDAEEKVSFIPRLKEKFLSLNTKQKAGSIAALILIFIVPIFIARSLNKTESQPVAETPVAPVVTPSEILANEKNINLSPEIQILAEQSGIIHMTVTGKGLAAVTKNSVLMVDKNDQREYAFPENSGATVRVSYMKDLSLVFILTDKNKIISFSPVSTKFTEDSIELPANPSGNLIGTYLTYLYVLDSQANQIYRYPRATGGFGARTSWLKDATSLAGISDIAIDDNIYCIQNNTVFKLFKGKKQEFNLENSNTPVNFDKIFTTIDSQSLYVLDAKNSRLVQYSKENGGITAQYFSEEFKYGTSLSIDEANKTAYVSTLNEILAISL